MAALFSILATFALWKSIPEMADVVLRALCGGRWQVRRDMQPFLPWNLSAERKKNWGNSASLRGLTRRREGGGGGGEEREEEKREGESWAEGRGEEASGPAHKT